LTRDNHVRLLTRTYGLAYEAGHTYHAAHIADNASACCKTFCTAASCKSGG
jgi:hypothetical protein